MGSSGSGKFGTYHEQLTNNREEGANVGNNDMDCPQRIENIILEDVAISEFFLNNGSLPIVGTKIQLINQPYKNRMAVADISSHNIIGNLPTDLNLLLICVNRGIVYTGDIVACGLNPIPYVLVSLNAN